MNRLSGVRKLEERIRDLERLLGRKTLEIETLRETPLAKSEAKTELAAVVAAEGRFPMAAQPYLQRSSPSDHDSWLSLRLI